MSTIGTENTCCGTVKTAGHDEEIMRLRRRLAELKGNSESEPGEVDDFYTFHRAGLSADRQQGSSDSGGDDARLSDVSRPDECQSSGTGQTLGEAEPGRSPDFEFINIPDMYENSKSAP